MLYQARTPHNFISVVEIPRNPPPEMAPLAGNRIMQLDSTGNIHSVYNTVPGPPKPTHSYWDILATLPWLTEQEGSLGILGLGAGTLARLVHAWRPAQLMEGWELDPAVVQAGRTYMGLGDVERAGVLTVHDSADALVAPPAEEAGRHACLAVDVFGEGQLPDALTQEQVWRGIKERLQPVGGSRLMINLGHPPGDSMPGQQTRRVLLALQAAFGADQVAVLRARNLGATRAADTNALAVTGPLESLNHRWTTALPRPLQYLSERNTWSLYQP